VTPPDRDPDDFEKTGRKVGGFVGALSGRVFGWIPAKHRKAIITTALAAVWTFAGDPLGLGPRQAAVWFNGPTIAKVKADVKKEMEPQLVKLSTEVSANTKETRSAKEGLEKLYEISSMITGFDKAREKLRKQKIEEKKKQKDRDELLNRNSPWGTGDPTNPNTWGAFESRDRGGDGFIQ
jgi:hypothetical protein